MTQKLAELNLDHISADQAENTARYSLLPTRVERLKAAILRQGGVHTPVVVAPLSGVKGKTHKLLAGFGRFAAVEALNKEGAGLKLPALVIDSLTGVDLLKRQISDNADRESMSPLDTAVAIKGLLDQGVSKGDVRSMFPRSTGKKAAIEPMSPALMNIYLNMLELPKAIQVAIHEGRVGVGAAYELTKVEPARRVEILERAEKNRLRDLEREAKEDARLAKSEESEGTKAEKLAAAEKALTEATEAHEATKVLIVEKEAAEKEAGKVPENYLTLPEAEKKPIAERLAAARTDLRGVRKEAIKTQNAMQKAEVALRRITNPDEKPEPTATPVNGKAKVKTTKKAVGAQDVKRAAKEAGASTKLIPATMKDINNLVQALTMSKAGKVTAPLGLLLRSFLEGTINQGVCRTEIEVLVGDRKRGKV